MSQQRPGDPGKISVPFEARLVTTNDYVTVVVLITGLRTQLKIGFEQVPNPATQDKF